MDPYRKIIKVAIIEVGDYSLFIDLMTNSIDEVKVLRIKSLDGNKRYESKEIIISDRKCIVYFDEPIKSAFRRGIYWGAYVSNADDTYWAVKDAKYQYFKKMDETLMYGGIYRNNNK